MQYTIVLDATGDDYGSDPDTYVVLSGTIDEGRTIEASCFASIAEAEAWIARFGNPAPFHMSADEAMPREDA